MELQMFSCSDICSAHCPLEGGLEVTVDKSYPHSVYCAQFDISEDIAHTLIGKFA